MDSLHILFDELQNDSLHNLCMATNGKNKPPDAHALKCGKLLADCRREHNLTQAALSKATLYKLRKDGLSPTQISNFEQGTRRIGYEEAEVLARVFTEYPSAYFLGAVDKLEAKMLIVLRTESGKIPKTG